MRFFFPILIFIILCGTIANAQINKESGQAYFDYAVFAFAEKNYKEAENNLELALRFDPYNPVYQHYMGKVYIETEHYQKAMHWFKQAEKIEPELSGLKTDMALVYYKQKKFHQASELFKILADKFPNDAFLQYYAGLSFLEIKQCKQAQKYFTRASEISPSVKIQGKYNFEACYQDKSSKPYTLFIMLSRLYDDNVGLQPENQEFFSQEDDWGTEAYIFGSYNFVNQNNFKIGTGIDLHQTWYDDLSDFDQTGSVFSLYTRYNLNPFSFGFSYYLFYHWLDSESAMRTHHLKPDVFWRINEKLTSSLSYSYYKDTDFLDSSRDGDIHNVFLKFSYKLPLKKSSLLAGIEYETKDASHPDESFKRIRSHLGLFFYLPWKLELGIIGKFVDKKYDNRDSTIGVTRNDDKYSGNISVSRNIYYEWLNLVAEYRYIKNDSNIKAYNYEKNQVILSLSAGF